MTRPRAEHRELVVRLDGRSAVWDVEGPYERGAAVVEVERDDDMTAGTPWADQGFTVVDHLDAQQLATLASGIAEIVRGELGEVGVECGDGWSLESYHRFVDDRQHHAFTDRNRCFVPLTELPIDPGALERVVSRTVGRPARLMPVPGRPPSFLVRVVRPGSKDHSPPHRDHWLDHLRGTIAAYLPVAGSGPVSSLPLVPGSHRWPASSVLRTAGRGVADGVQYGVPAVAGSDRTIELIRPDPAPGRLLVFSPYLVHGGAINRQPDTTRVSLELRFEPAD